MVSQIVSDFNVGEDTVAFIDDSVFEREQVSAVLPNVRVYPAELYPELLGRPEFSPPVTAESSKRRVYYLGQKRRAEARASAGGDYFDFLRQCDITVEVFPAARENLGRIHELVQRTNQMNFSGNRYSRQQIESLIDDEHYDAYCVQCEDRFGEYGLVGFCLVEHSIPHMMDLMFSCRVQNKRVEHAFMSFLLRHYRDQGLRSFAASYCRTDKNEMVGQVFDDLGFAESESEGPRSKFTYDLSNDIPDDELILVVTRVPR
jgi:FkbH-like protein